jgi:hypothetical protein
LKPFSLSRIDLMMKKSLFLALSLLLVSAASQAADTCEPLRAQIEAKIASKGVANFTVTVVEADASVAGEVVGNCAQGTKKIVYAKGAADQAEQKPAAAVVSPASARKAPADGMLTECKDGTVNTGGGCKP